MNNNNELLENIDNNKQIKNRIFSQEIQRDQKIKNQKIVLFILLIIFFIAIITYSIVILDYSKIIKLNYPVNSSQKVCQIQFINKFPYLYISLNGPKPTYHCVNQCPSGWNQFTIINSEGLEIYYPSQQFVSTRMGGICWSTDKQQILKNKGYYNELQYKHSLMDYFKNIIIIVISAFLLSFLMIIIFYLLPQQIIHYASPVFSISLLIFTLAILSKQQFQGKEYLLLIVGIGSIFYLISLVCGFSKLKQCLIYTNLTIKKIQNTESFLQKTIAIVIIFNIINFGFLILILFQYICLVSSDQLVKRQENVYFTIKKTWWKYILLFIQWFVGSIIIKQFYIYKVVRSAITLHRKIQAQYANLDFRNSISIVNYAMIQFMLWLPLRIIQVIKPSGAIVRSEQDETIGNKFTRAIHCLCGYCINKIYRYTLNPYLVLSHQDYFYDISQALNMVYQGYHRHSEYDKSSLWIYRLSNYIIVIILSILSMNLLGKSGQNLLQIHIIFFYLFGCLLAVQVSRLNINLWTILSQTTEFTQISR